MWNLTSTWCGTVGDDPSHCTSFRVVRIDSPVYMMGTDQLTKSKHGSKVYRKAGKKS